MEIKIAVSGISPLILNRFTDAAAMAASNGSRSSAAAGSRGTPREIAEGKLYYGINGRLLRCQRIAKGPASAGPA